MKAYFEHDGDFVRCRVLDAADWVDPEAQVLVRFTETMGKCRKGDEATVALKQIVLESSL